MISVSTLANLEGAKQHCSSNQISVVMERREFATDLCFKATLETLYPKFLHHGIRSFSSPDILRFLGRVAPEHFCNGEVKSSLKHRPGGIRLRHSVNGNWSSFP